MIPVTEVSSRIAFIFTRLRRSFRIFKLVFTQESGFVTGPSVVATIDRSTVDIFCDIPT